MHGWPALSYLPLPAVREEEGEPYHLSRGRGWEDPELWEITQAFYVSSSLSPKTMLSLLPSMPFTLRKENAMPAHTCKNSCLCIEGPFCSLRQFWVNGKHRRES